MSSRTSATIGRKQAKEWSLFIEIPNSTKSRCKSCSMEVSSKIERLRSHLEACKKNDETGDEIFLFDDNDDNDELVGEVPPVKRHKQQASMNNFTMKTTAGQRAQLDKCVANFFFANNIPFNVANNKYFIEMINKLRPGYNPPSRLVISDKLLPQIYTELNETLKVELSSSPSTTLLIDGWTNKSNDAILATAVFNGKTSFPFSADDSGSEKKTSEYCADVVKKSIEELRENFGKKVFAVCSDNENKMKKMRSILEKDLNVVTYGCSAHYLNLVYSEIIPNTLIKQIVEIQKFFRNHHQPHAWLKEKNGLMPQLPCETRWNSHNACLNSFISNYSLYAQIKLEHLTNGDFDSRISNLLGNVGLYSEAVHLSEQLNVLTNALNLLQSDKTTIAISLDIWYDLLDSEICKNSSTICKAVKKRLKEAITPAHLIAYWMHPQYMGTKLSADDELNAEQWIISKNPDFLPFLMAFKIKDNDFYPSSMFRKEVLELSALKWWQILKQKNNKTHKFPDEFLEFMIGLMSCPASSASIERMFSTYGLVWSKLRNRLGSERAFMLVKIYKILRRTNTDEQIHEDNEW